MSDVTDSDLATIARIVAEIDGLGVPSTASEVADRLRRLHVRLFNAEQQCKRLTADVTNARQELHDLRNADAHKLAAADLAALRLRQGIDAALAVFHDDSFPCEESCHRMAAELRAAVAAADAVDTQ